MVNGMLLKNWACTFTTMAVAVKQNQIKINILRPKMNEFDKELVSFSN